jgi:hypothetical protein
VTDETVAVDDWAAVERGLRGFDGTVDADDDRLTLRKGSARFAVTRDGRVEAGMPLHAFAGEAETLRFDHEEGTIGVSAAGVDYEFRVP